MRGTRWEAEDGVIRILARPVNRAGSRLPIPASTDLLPLQHHREARPKWGIYTCHTRAGRPRAYCEPDRDGKCIHCGYLDPDLDRPLGETAH